MDGKFMMKNLTGCSLAALLSLTQLLPGAEVVINEFMAINNSVLRDEDLDFSDWIELKNLSSGTVDLAGWRLTDKADNLNRWQFPAATIPPGGFLVVFASDKNRAVAGSELHTNFKLSGDGEYLGLIRPDGVTVESEYAPVFPPQIADISYGLAGQLTALTLIDDNSACTAFVPEDDTAGTAWMLAGFDDSAWLRGTPGIGYDRDTRYAPLISLDVYTQMYNRNCTVYIRIPFTVTDADAITALTLRMKYDDGFIAYLNGVAVASAKAPAMPAWNSTATADNPDSLAEVFVTYDITAFADALTDGPNMLAIHGLNRTLTSSDMLIVPQLECTSVSDAATEAGYLQQPTPGSENAAIIPEFSEAVAISVPGRVCLAPVVVTISAVAPVDNIYYTLDGSEPTRSSAEYTSPITIGSTASLRARSFTAGLALGPISSETYLFVESDMHAFSSDLPVVVVDNLDGGNIPEPTKQSAFIAFFEQGPEGRTRVTNNFSLASRAGIRRRGESSLRETNRKPNLAVESWPQGADDDSNIAPLGMPSESDWVLWAPWSFDPAGIRNALIYNISNQSGNYAVRTRFVEVFLNVSGGNLSMADYVGMYVFMEKIKRDKNRVAVEKMTPFENTEPAVTGGYILRIDKYDPNQNLLSGMAQPNLYCIDPLPAAITPQQESWITDFIINFEAQRGNPDAVSGYPAYIDQDSFIYHNIFNMVTKNVDGLRLSTYMSKQRGGKLAMGPIWDFDRSMDSTDGRDNSPEGWLADTKYIDYDSRAVWWGPLFENADFWQRYIDHWQSLRLTVLSDTNVFATIDAMAAAVAEAKARDITRWTGTSGYALPRTGSNGLNGTQQGEINYLKWWLAARMAWVDTQFLPRPVITPAGGAIAATTAVTLSVPAGAAVYYTTDGSDPRTPGGSLSAAALPYTGALAVAPGSIVRARAWNGAAWGGNPPEEAPWSGVTQAVFPRADPCLLITEIHYHPADPEPSSPFTDNDFEFLELHNSSGEPLSLNGYALDRGIAFSFDSAACQTLPAGGYLIIVKNLAAFAARYDTNALCIAGEYSGNLSNSGESLRLVFHGEKHYEIAYSDGCGWPCAADGGGHSLIPDTSAVALHGFDTLAYPGNWRASTYSGGSPGAEDPPPPPGIVINEIIAHTDTGLDAPFDSNDLIELYNPLDTPVTLDGFWYLSDNREKPQKWNIPAGTTIPAGGWLLFDESDFNPDGVSGFGLNKAGEEVVLSHRPGADLDRIVDCVVFQGQANGDSLGRYPDGNPYFQRLPPTPGAANLAPPPGIRIQELMYHPLAVEGINANDVLEYILLTNTAASAITLEGLDGCAHTWRFSDGIEFVFPPDTSLAGGANLWLVPFNPATEIDKKLLFCTTYGLDTEDVRLLGPYQGRLSNSGERIALESPQPSDNPADPESISWIIIDEIIWLDHAPWPAAADGTGLALKRVGYAGNDPLSWTISAAIGFGNQCTHEKLSPGDNSWSSFLTMDGLSNTDYADVNSGHGVTVHVAAGTLNSSCGSPSVLLNGIGPVLIFDVKNAVFFDLGSSGRIQMNLHRVIPLARINTYTWHPGNRQNQRYALYYSAATLAPAAGPEVFNPVETGWKLLGSVNTGYSEASTGQIGVSFHNRFNEPLAFARHLLWDLADGSSSFTEFDVSMQGGFVTNFVPEAWLALHGLPATDAAALADSDGDGLLNWEEFYAGTNPTRADSVFRISAGAAAAGQQSVRWRAVAGKTYTLQFKSDLSAADWTTLESGIPGAEPECERVLSLPESSGFFRILVE